MNIIELCLSYGKGGLELYMARCVRELSRGHRVYPVVAPGNSFLRDRLRDGGFTSSELRVRLPELPLLAARKLAGTIDRDRIDVIHVHSLKDLPVTSVAKRFSNRNPRLVITMQMSVSQNKQNFYHHFIYSPVDSFLVITRQLQAQFQHRIHPEFVERVHLLYYGTESHDDLQQDRLDALKKRIGIRPDAFTVGLFGKRNEGKGQHLLIEALKEMRGDGMDVMGLIVGPATDAKYNRIIMDLISDGKLEKDIVVLDFVENPQQLMQFCHCVVLASYKETFGLVLIEAMSAGTAIIGSNQGGVPEIIDDGETGLLFESRNAGSLGQEIRKLYENRILLERLARQGRRKAENSFSYKHHYENLLGHLKTEIHERTEIAVTPE